MIGFGERESLGLSFSNTFSLSSPFSSPRRKVSCLFRWPQTHLGVPRERRRLVLVLVVHVGGERGGGGRLDFYDLFWMV